MAGKEHLLVGNCGVLRIRLSQDQFVVAFKIVQFKGKRLLATMVSCRLDA